MEIFITVQLLTETAEVYLLIQFTHTLTVQIFMV